MAVKKKADAKQDTATQLPFEDAMEQLEEIVRKLEAGDVALEESLAAFEKGVGLVRVLHQRLDAVQEKIEELTRTDQGDLVTKQLDTE
jgi:exodeoxyribonuclease VII small subunit